MNHVISFIFVLLPFLGFGQSYHCLYKQNEFAQWQPVEADITVLTGDKPKEKIIQLQEVEGIILTVTYDTISELNDCLYYTYKEGIRMVVPNTVGESSKRIITILNKNFVCPQNN